MCGDGTSGFGRAIQYYVCMDENDHTMTTFTSTSDVIANFKVIANSYLQSSRMCTEKSMLLYLRQSLMLADRFIRWFRQD